MKTLTNTLYLYEETNFKGIARSYFTPIRRIYLNADNAEAMVLRLNIKYQRVGSMCTTSFRVLSNKALSNNELMFLNK